MTVDFHAGRSFVVVAVDGGAASGKSSTSRLLARRRNYMHVDTGSHYRAVTLACIRSGIPAEDSEAMRVFLDQLDLSSVITGHESLVCFNGNPPPNGRDLRSAAVNRLVSPYAAIPAVRSAVKAYQRAQVSLARDSGFSGIIMDGRDIGTVILPDADLKIFLVADSATRQRRRALEGSSDTIAARDKTDSTRAVAPMKPAPDAVVIDNSGIPLEEVVSRVEALIDKSCNCN